MTRGLALAAVGAMLVTSCSSRPEHASLPPAKPVRMEAAAPYVLRRCERSQLLAPACPRRLPYVGPQPAWDVSLCRAGRPGCLGLTWDDLELQHAESGPQKPPTWSHVAVFAGDLGRAFPFEYPAHGKAAQLKDGLFARPRAHATFFGQLRWAGRTGSLVLAPGYPGGGEQGDHLIFRWRRAKVGYAVGLHGWEPLTQAAATLKAIVESTAGR